MPLFQPSYRVSKTLNKATVHSILLAAASVFERPTALPPTSDAWRSLVLQICGYSPPCICCKMCGWLP
jgi:hypothetical protein